MASVVQQKEVSTWVELDASKTYKAVVKEKEVIIRVIQEVVISAIRGINVDAQLIEKRTQVNQ